MRANRRSVCHCGLALSLLASAVPASAAGWDWTYTFSSSARVDTHPIAISSPNANGFWAVGDALLHYHADGNLDFAAGDGYFTIGNAAAARSGFFANGGLVLLTQPTRFFEEPLYCKIYNYSSQG